MTVAEVSVDTALGGAAILNPVRLAAVAQVIANYPASASDETLAERVGPGEHRRPARERDQGSIVITEALDAQDDPIGFHSGHQLSTVFLRPSSIVDQFFS